jgi:elongation factor G
MDRIGADFNEVVNEIRERLTTVPLVLQIPIGSELNFEGVIDIIKQQAVVWKDEKGDIFEIQEIPPELKNEAEDKKTELLETLAEFDEDFFDLYMNEDSYSNEDVVRSIRKLCLEQKAVPVLCGAAFKNKGVQPLLDAIAAYLPSPEEMPIIEAENPENGEQILITRDEEEKFTGLVFKVTTDKHMGKISMLRIYSGSLKNGDTILNNRTNEKHRISRILQMQSDKTIAIEKAKAGDIVAIIGIKDAKTGDSLSDMDFAVLLESIKIPTPVIRVAIEPKINGDEKTFGLVLAKIQEEDPSLLVEKDPQTGQTLLSGLGELHLEVTLEKIRLNHGLEINQGKPKVSYKEVLTKSITHREKFVKQNSGSGQFADVTFEIGPRTDSEKGLLFVSQIKGGVVPQEFIPSVEKGFREAMRHGPLLGYPLESMQVTLLDGSIHSVDSHALDFEIAARDGYRVAAKKCAPKILEPIMKVEIQSIEDHTGAITTDINKRRGIILSIDEKAGRKLFTAEVPLSNTFGYISDLRTLTSGRATISMKVSHYAMVPEFVAEQLLK